MSTFIVLSPKEGSIARYEGVISTDGPRVRKTHGATLDQPHNFGQATIDLFRYDPPAKFSTRSQIDGKAIA